jgi:hypothetical protein
MHLDNTFEQEYILSVILQEQDGTNNQKSNHPTIRGHQGCSSSSTTVPTDDPFFVGSNSIGAYPHEL